jgi:chemotaxis protein histidine kinase CheA
MAFTVQDFEDLVRLLEEKPEWRERMRQLILTRELLQLPDLVRQLIESVQRLSEEFAAYRQLTDQRFAELAEAQQRTEQRLQQLSEEFAAYRQLTDQRFAELAEAQQRTEQRLQQLSEEFAAYRQLTDQRFAELAEAQQRTEQRLQQLSEEFAAYRQLTDQRFAELAEAQQRTEQRLQQLSEEFAAYRQLTDQRFAELAEAQQRTEQRLQQLSEEFAAYRQLTDQRFAETNQQIADLVTAVRDLVRRLERLEDWQRGESGRRDGERYEQQVIARAPALFYGGSGGGMGEPHIREQLGRWLASLYRQGIEIDEHDDPLLADLIWWKGDRVMVTEVSLKVDAQDVRRAAARARTLRQVGINATPTVIGREWATPDTQALAQQEGVEWMVGSGLSQGFLEFRQISDGQEEAE